MSSTPRDVFVSYNRSDRAWAEWIAWVLEETGYSVAVQAWDSRPGQNFVFFMQEATRARQTVAVLSPSYLEASYTHSEWTAAFARDPQGTERTLIPVRVAECEPDGLLGQIVYADLVGLDEDSARGTLLTAFEERGKPPTAPLFPGSGTRSIEARLKPAFPGPSVAVSIGKLPVTGPTFVAREAELARLDAAWEAGTHVISLVAMGGAGKSALVNEWLGRMQEEGWRGAERVLGWSFYSQGTDAAGASSEAFTEYALDWLGHRGEVIKSPWKKGEVLAGLVRQARTLLVLDGLEPLQHPPGAHRGRIKDPAVQALVRELAAENPGLCVITSRLEVTDVAGRAGTESGDREMLPTEAGAELLRQLGVKGKKAELRAASEELGGHGLALTLLGTYLRDVCGGDVRRRGEAAVLDETAGIEGSDHARNVMAAYESWLGPGLEVQVLRLLGLFDRPAETAALAALRAAPKIPGITEGIGAGEEKAWRSALARLRQARLVVPVDASSSSARSPLGGESLESHPLVREYFGQRLRQTDPEAWLEGNRRLYEHYKQAAPDYPDTLEAMLPLYAAVVHGSRAGKAEEVLDEVYWRRIRREHEHFSLRRLGAFGVELSTLAAFFEQPWARPSESLSPKWSSWIVTETGSALRALGRLSEAVHSLEAGLELRLRLEDWEESALSANNLCEAVLALGDVPRAVVIARQGVDLADRSFSLKWRMISRTTLAHAFHQAGWWRESMEVFREAEVLQKRLQPRYPQLYGLGGFQYCSLLLDIAEPEGEPIRYLVEVENRDIFGETWSRSKFALGIAERDGAHLDIALAQLSLGRATLKFSITSNVGIEEHGLVEERFDTAIEALGVST